MWDHHEQLNNEIPIKFHTKEFTDFKWVTVD